MEDSPLQRTVGAQGRGVRADHAARVGEHPAHLVLSVAKGQDHRLVDPVLRRQQQLADKVDGLQPHIPANIGQTLSGQLGTGPVLRQENPLPIALGQPRHNTAVRPHSPPHLGIA